MVKIPLKLPFKFLSVPQSIREMKVDVNLNHEDINPLIHYNITDK